MVGYQVLGTVCCVGMGITFGCMAGFIMARFYIIDPINFYMDNIYFHVDEELKTLKCR
jgi:hypothetical protein